MYQAACFLLVAVLLNIALDNKLFPMYEPAATWIFFFCCIMALYAIVKKARE